MTHIDLFNNIVQSDRYALSKAVTLVESLDSGKQADRIALLKKCLPYQGKAFRIGITGPPGVGKSTFINAFAMELVRHQKRVAILAVDPSSEQSKGSILGDKTRMHDLVGLEEVFIRPSANQGQVGGVHMAAYNIAMLFDAAGYDVILFETVGVGQSELLVKHLVDCVYMLTIAGAGDELQGIKKGILEIADFLMINKVEDPSLPLVKSTLIQYRNAFSSYVKAPELMTCSAEQKQGILEIWQKTLNLYPLLSQEPRVLFKRKQQQKDWFMLAWEESWKSMLTQSSFYHASKNVHLLVDRTLEEQFMALNEAFLKQIKH